MATTKKKADRCNLKEQRWCTGMDATLQGVTNSKGLVLMRTINRNTGKQMSTMVVYKKSAGDAGLLLNACPWCRAKLGQAK